jgi:hypothetical protein
MDAVRLLIPAMIRVAPEDDLDPVMPHAVIVSPGG